MFQWKVKAGDLEGTITLSTEDPTKNVNMKYDGSQGLRETFFDKQKTYFNAYGQIVNFSKTLSAQDIDFVFNTKQKPKELKTQLTEGTIPDPVLLPDVQY